MAAVAVLLSSCQRAVAPMTDTPPLAPLKIDPGSQRFRIVPDQSRLVLLVYREGQLARVGHNHVISTDGLQGTIYLSESIAESVAELRIAVNEFSVDKPELRDEFGDDFPGELEAAAIDGTRSNMLGDEQLNVAAWPEIILRSRSVSGQWPNLIMNVDLALQGRVHSLEVPAQVERHGNTLVALLAFPLLQTDIGLTPFSVMMGALRVRDQIDVRLRIVALAD